VVRHRIGGVAVPVETADDLFRGAGRSGAEIVPERSANADAALSPREPLQKTPANEAPTIVSVPTPAASACSSRGWSWPAEANRITACAASPSKASRILRASSAPAAALSATVELAVAAWVMSGPPAAVSGWNSTAPQVGTKLLRMRTSDKPSNGRRSDA
jgi:hypothetical protein